MCIRDRFLGGHFTSDAITSPNLPYLAKISTSVSTSSQLIDDPITIFPNPVETYINLDGLDRNFEYQIFDLSGKNLKSGFSASNRLQLEDLPKGIFLLHVKVDSGSYNFKLVKT